MNNSFMGDFKMYVMKINEKREFIWTEVSNPVLGCGEVLIKTNAAAVNRADLMQRAGIYPPPLGWPDWPGLEISGTIADANGSQKFKDGDFVCALLGGGGYAEYSAVPENLVMPIPAGFSLTEAASLPEVFATSYLDLKLTAKLQPGENVFIYAGASGLGIAATQIARFLGAASVITTVGSDRKKDLIKKFGADIIVNRKKEDLGQAFKDNSISVVVDCVGTGISELVDKMAPGGRWVIVANLGGATATIPLAQMYKRNISVIGITLRSRPEETKSAILAGLVKEIWPELSAGRIQQNIYKVLPISEVEAAHSILERNENIGKVILKIEE